MKIRTIATRTRRYAALGAATALAAALLVPAVGPAAPAQAAPTFSTPAVNGIEFPPVAPPGASFKPITVTAEPGPRPAVVGAKATTVFKVSPLAPWTTYHAARHLIVDWRNLSTGETGSEDLRYWEDRPTPPVNPIPGSGNDFAELPTSVGAATGAGPVVATVRIIWKTYNDPPKDIQVLPGTIGILAE